ncbi:MAG: hypothetical protein F6J98_49400 [Moorea sp. SIO4G2]|uniref:Uncharacterized protein n=1 Tax=Moorena bouillonii PNG TaxID=568701 RepID=A0A1U7N3S3_9CYAN|nr:hypothetical protein [Moorena sp. SIO3E8]NEO25141.1 hypothetical protein [Moorena sp. SIO4A5]NEO67934.1 hypothetical protein [Moorena sp. SIO4G2]NEQ03471.1 hypothetical protein [Moorena sp. SIO3F7]NEQ79448.1 hypothetical protein [Moorena sp. SIO2I5]OLT60602.1 hypothetical protein BJP37_17895 [Moorena bouillonii PNG]
MAVTKGKVSGNSRYLQGFEQTANLLTVFKISRFQEGSVMDFFERRSRYGSKLLWLNRVI